MTATTTIAKSNDVNWENVAHRLAAFAHDPTGQCRGPSGEPFTPEEWIAYAISTTASWRDDMPHRKPEELGDIEGLKLEINRLVWTYMPSTMTLDEADREANAILGLFEDAYKHAPEAQNGKGS